MPLFGMQKLSPAACVTGDEVGAYIRARRLAYNPMHDGRLSHHLLRAPPATRAIEPGQGSRGRALVVGESYPPTVGGSATELPGSYQRFVMQRTHLQRLEVRKHPIFREVVAEARVSRSCCSRRH